MNATAPATPPATERKAGLAALTVGALGIVYGDIGTSPLYAFKEAFNGPHALAVGEVQVLATLSTLFWAVMLIISLKYVWIVLRFDNEGEGGVLALTALAHRLSHRRPRLALAVVGAGIFAAALFYGDALITPAISVLSAIEGLAVVSPDFGRAVVPLTVAILVSLFAIQRHGTSRVGRLFGPVTMLWFLALAVLGALSIAAQPAVLQALDPRHALGFAVARPGAAFLLLSAVFLALTGGEALYADMGHFGARPVRIAWYGLVCPALLLNYFGQGALVLRHPEAVANPFYLLAPAWFQLPLVALATAATVIASQATITGAYSMTLQASRLGYLPRLRILHTSDTERGQIYIPGVNWLMLAGVVWLVLEFRSSGALAAAYGIAVSGTMIITTVLAAFASLLLARRARRVGLLAALAVFAGLEVLFLAANLTKIGDGGWLPMALGALIFLLLTTWKEGSALVADERQRLDIPLPAFVACPPLDVPRVPGTAVYLTSDPAIVPSALFHNLKHYKVMHERTLFLNVVGEEVPRVDPAQRVAVVDLAPGMQQVSVRFGFREEPDVMAALAAADDRLQLDPMTSTFFVARSTIADGPGGLPRWRCGLFAWMTRQSESAASFFGLPANRVVELGTQVLL